jgi:hypothetical protein
MTKKPSSEKKHVKSAVSVWAEFDELGALDNAIARLEEAGAPPNFVCITGKHPHRRGHLYFQLTERTSELERVTRLNRALGEALNGDHVFNFDRVMRLPGTVAWPIPSKPGRVPELTRLVRQGIRDERYSLEELEALFGSIAPAGRHDAEPVATPVQSSNDRAVAWARAALVEEVAQVTTAAPHTGNITLARSAFKIGQLVGANLLCREEAEVALLAAGLSRGLTRSECKATISRQLTEGARTPRYPEPLPAAANEPGAVVHEPLSAGALRL